MSWRLLLISVIFVAACAVQPRAIIVPSAQTGHEVLPVFVGTTRAVDPQGRPSWDAIPGPLAYATHQVAYPRTRAPGEVPMARARPDPETDFAIAAIAPFASPAAFSQSLRATLTQRPAGRRQVLVYVHGFNVTFAEGLYRTAQIVRDWDIAHVPAYFSWPSTLSPVEYRHDRRALQDSQQALARFLTAIVDAGAEGIVLLAHSLGAELVTETVAGLQTGGNRAILERIDGVFLVSPDLSVERFREITDARPPLPEPFVVFTSAEDRILRFSSLAHGGSMRLGNLTDPALLADRGVLLLDLTSYREGHLDHRAAFSAPRFLAEFDRWRSRPDEVGQALRVLTGR